MVVQNDNLAQPATVLVCLMTSDVDGFADSRLLVEPTTENGLRTASVVMTEKIYPVSRAKTQARIGRLSEPVMAQLNNRLAFVLGLGD